MSEKTVPTAKNKQYTDLDLKSQLEQEVDEFLVNLYRTYCKYDDNDNVIGRFPESEWNSQTNKAAAKAKDGITRIIVNTLESLLSGKFRDDKSSSFDRIKRM